MRTQDGYRKRNSETERAEQSRLRADAASDAGRRELQRGGEAKRRELTRSHMHLRPCFSLDVQAAALSKQIRDTHSKSSNRRQHQTDRHPDSNSRRSSRRQCSSSRSRITRREPTSQH